MEIFNTERFCLLRMNSFGFKQIRKRIHNISVSQLISSQLYGRGGKLSYVQKLLSDTVLLWQPDVRLLCRPEAVCRSVVLCSDGEVGCI